MYICIINNYLFELQPMKKIFSLSILLLSTQSIGFGGSGGLPELKDSLVNKAAGHVEFLTNAIANKLVNKYGEGNTEISIRNLKGDGPDIDIITVQPLSPKDQNSQLFWQGSIGSYYNDDERDTTLNLGIGNRWLLDNETAIGGVNAFTDYEFSSGHNRLSLGAEYKRTNFEISTNNYWGTSSTKNVNGIDEDALDGRDISIKGKAPYAPWLSLTAEKYQWDRTSQDDIKGDLYGLEMNLTPEITLEIGTQDDNYMDKESFAKVTYSLNANNKYSLESHKTINSPWLDGKSMRDNLLDKVKRSNKIVVESGGINISRRD